MVKPIYECPNCELCYEHYSQQTKHELNDGNGEKSQGDRWKGDKTADTFTQICQTIDCDKEGEVKVRDGYKWIWSCLIHAQGYEIWRKVEDED